MEKIKIRKGQGKDIIPSSNLIYRTFKEFNKNEGTPEGVENYLNLHDPNKNLEKINKRYLTSKIFFIAEDKGKIIGIIKGNESRIGNLFVEKEYHHKGIARKLIERFEKEAKKLKSNKIKVTSSLYSIGFYEKSGYKKSTGLKEGRGLKFQPMAKELK